MIAFRRPSDARQCWSAVDGDDVLAHVKGNPERELVTFCFASGVWLLLRKVVAL